MATAKAPSIDVFESEEAAAAQRQIVSGVDTSVDTIPIVFLVKSKADRAAPRSTCRSAPTAAAGGSTSTTSRSRSSPTGSRWRSPSTASACSTATR